MSINYAILGILSWRSLTGYDLKKIIQESPFMYWSGNNNQIYKSLVELLEEGLVTNEVQHQESAPSKKIYTITEEGIAELREWVLSSPEPPEFKKMFLVQLAWSNQLSDDEISSLLSRYENEVRMQILMQQEKRRRETFSPVRAPREAKLWELIHDNLISSYENELNWIQKVRAGIFEDIKEINKMNLKVVKKENKKYILCDSEAAVVCSERDALDLCVACMENKTDLLMLHAEALSDDFFRLRTGLAGQMLQKFINYQVRVAVILTDDGKVKGKFRELLSETNRGKDFRTFTNTEEAENWLLNLNSNRRDS